MNDEMCYEKSFLKQVIVRIDFAAPLEKLDKAPPTRFVTPIASHFPIIEPTDVVTQEVSFNPDGIAHRNITERQWNYFSRDRDRQLTISPTAAYIQYTRYTAFKEMKKHFEVLTDAIGVAFPGTIVARFGLRYINQIEGLVDDATQWGEFINNDLIKPRAFFLEDDSLTRLVNISELQYGSVAIRFQHGMPNPDFPATIRRPMFVIDIDATVSEAHDLNQSKAYIDEAHTRIQDLFERSITQALRERMNVQEPV